ncbi:MAG: AgmX/PglI C-terminal domain-containing protein [Myxococcaceae bacterium]|nr:AgmX/PglI C-terminal domain-containing protein [Myxococcaceae bacterium]
MSAQPSVLQVVILRDGLLVGTEVFVPGTYAIGSDPSSDLLLDDASIDPRHAVLYFQNGRSAIQDAGSAQGVYVNGHRISACEIRPVDEVLCGPFVLKTRVLSQRPADKPLPPPEVAALLGGAPQPAAPQAAVRPLRPAPMAATTPARPSAAPPPEEPAPPPSQLAAATVPIGYAPPSAARLQDAQATVVPLGQPAPGPAPMAQAQHRGPPAAGRGGPAVAHAPRHLSNPAVVPLQPAPAAPVPANTVPSARRRATQDLLPTQEPAPATLADDLFGDLLPSPQAPSEEWPPAPQDEPIEQHAPVPQRRMSSPAVHPQGRMSSPAVHPQGRMSSPAAHALPPQDPDRPTNAPQMGPGKGPARLYLELYWGGVRREARSYKPGKEPLVASTEDKPTAMPLWGFALPEEGFTLAEPLNGAFRLYVPAGSTVEKANAGARYQAVPLTALEADGTRRFITLRDGTAARLSQGQMSLVAYAAPKPERVWVNPLAGLPWLALFFYALFGAGFGAFIALRPQSPESPDFTQKNLPPVALRLLAPEAKKKEEAKKKLEAIKEKAKKPEKKVAEKPTPKPVEKKPPPPKKEVAPPPPESKALKALAKLSAAGPATNDVLAAVDKLGSGPGSKNVKTSNYKLSGLIGKAPIANAGLGTFGLGGGGKGGGATLGAELLRGKGAGGIGALGAGGVGKGKVGGTVTRATTRSISATQGTIDREGVARVINSHLQEVHACYERALLKDPGLAGKVVLEWTIGLSGSVTAAKTKSSTLRNSAVEACILSSLKKWTFPAPKGGLVIITYPFIFNSVGY